MHKASRPAVRHRRSCRPTPEFLEGRQLMAVSAALNQQLDAASFGLAQVMEDNQIALDSVTYTYQGIGSSADTQALSEQGNSVALAAGGTDWSEAWGDVLSARALLEQAYQAWLADPSDAGDPPWYQLQQQAETLETAPVIGQVFQLIADDESSPTWTPPPSQPTPLPIPTPQPTPPPPHKPLPNPSPLTLSQKVLHLAAEDNGKTIGDGSCWAFVETVLDDAGAEDSQHYRPKGMSDEVFKHYNYVWGNLVTDLTPESHSTADIRPGYIIQTIGVKASWYPDTPPPPGTKYGSPATYGAGHHSAIVVSVWYNKLTVMEQTKVNGVQAVKYTTLNLDGLYKGTIKVYSPVAK